MFRIRSLLHLTRGAEEKGTSGRIKGLIAEWGERAPKHKGLSRKALRTLDCDKVYLGVVSTSVSFPGIRVSISCWMKLPGWDGI